MIPVHFIDITYIEARNFMQRICLEKTVERVSSTLWNIKGLTSLLYYSFKYYLSIYIYVF
jgi:hypothetical protein